MKSIKTIFAVILSTSLASCASLFPSPEKLKAEMEAKSKEAAEVSKEFAQCFIAKNTEFLKKITECKTEIVIKKQPNSVGGKIAIKMADCLATEIIKDEKFEENLNEHLKQCSVKAVK
jgi:hypothetical protein